MITCAKDVIEILEPMSSIKRQQPSTLFDHLQEQPVIEHIDVEQSTREIVLNALGTHGVEIDELIRATDLPSRDVRVVLLELELDGRIEHDGAQTIRLLSA